MFYLSSPISTWSYFYCVVVLRLTNVGLLYNPNKDVPDQAVCIKLL